MQTNLSSEFKGTPDGEAAEAILRKCVHCGFCTATCPTYQLLGDELDGPRGRIYLIKEVLEGAVPTRKTQSHLDRCLTCRNCETTCPSGVQYGNLVEIGRRIVDEKVERPRGEQAVRWLLKEGLTSPLFAPATLGRRQMVSLNSMGIAYGSFWPLLAGFILTDLPKITLLTLIGNGVLSGQSGGVIAVLVLVGLQLPLTFGFMGAAYRQLEYWSPSEPK